MSDRRLPGADLRTLLRPALPTRSSAQALAEDFIPALLAPRPAATVVDLGCGRGDSVDAFRAADPAVRWIGVEVGDSEYETRPDVELRIFDGVRCRSRTRASTSSSPSRCSSTSSARTS